MNQETSFGNAVLRKAWTDSRALLRSRLQATLTGLVSLSVGIGAQWLTGGLSLSLRSAVVTGVSTLGTALILFATKFSWHLLLAPSEIIYDTIRPIFQNAPMFGVARPTNYSIWRWKKSYLAGEFAALLAGIDPSSPAATVDSQSYLKLVLDDLRTNVLKYSRPQGMGTAGVYNPDVGAEISKDDALEWAEARGFDAQIRLLR